ncbi:hypothetical protein NPJ88_003660 [Halomonas elongata]|uniref:hypothetical protein n=1 Tax=Halomonas elongata TaxID=2746 RepID=UPI00255B0A86|nr:hypothetical protein [Halomonas elongata]MDL4861422.1 hypothetical protein [Halomonas elongata]
MILLLGVSRFSRWEILASGGLRSRFFGFISAQSLGQLLGQAVAIHPVPRLGRNSLPDLLEDADGHQLAPRGLLLLGTHPGLGFPTIVGALLFFPEPSITLPGRWRVAQEQRLAQEDRALHRHTRKLSEHRLVGHGAAQEGREHGGGNIAHAAALPM